MALKLGELEKNSWLDNFMVREGYDLKTHFYHRVIGCWCGSNSLRDLSGAPDSFHNYQLCENCGCLLLKYVLPITDLNELYGIRYFREHQQAIGLPPFNERYESDVIDRIPVWIEVLKEYCLKGRILEIGSSHGRFVKELADKGYAAVGIELDTDICSWAIDKTGCDIRCISLDELHNETFDIVFANDVIEHIYNPMKFIDKIIGVLNTNGKALLQTVIFDDWESCPVGMLRPLYHTILYSRRSLILLQNARTAFVTDKPAAFNCNFAIFMKTTPIT